MWPARQWEINPLKHVLKHQRWEGFQSAQKRSVCRGESDPCTPIQVASETACGQGNSMMHKEELITDCIARRIQQDSKGALALSLLKLAYLHDSCYDLLVHLLWHEQ